MALVVLKAARRALKNMPKADADRMSERLERLAAGGSGLDVKALVGSDRMRLRSGDWRAIFTRDGDDVVVSSIAHRREAYRKD